MYKYSCHFDKLNICFQNTEDACKKLQFCSSCSGYKAPRSHHCRQCELKLAILIIPQIINFDFMLFRRTLCYEGQLSLRATREIKLILLINSLFNAFTCLQMDHHVSLSGVWYFCITIINNFANIFQCPWINGCVGHSNQANFVTFLVAAVIGCSEATIILSFSLYHAVYRTYYIYYDIEAPIVYLSIYGFIWCLFSLGCAFGVAFGCSMLLYYQVSKRVVQCSLQLIVILTVLLSPID